MLNPEVGFVTCEQQPAIAADDRLAQRELDP